MASIVAERRQQARRVIVPETFRTSRLLDFASERELVAQIGHGRSDWPRVVLKELIDNALDAAEEAGVAPEIKVRASEHAILVADNGPGIPGDVIDSVVDFTVRVSSREAYVGPTRGAQGNALKTLAVMPFALDGNAGSMIVKSRGLHHEIRVFIDHIAQQPRVVITRRPSLVRNGSIVAFAWPHSASSILAGALPYLSRLTAEFALFNPHLRLAARVGDDVQTFEPTNTAWRRWRPSDPPPAQWYDLARFERLLAAMIHADRKAGRRRTVREFMSDFRGLASTAKQKAILGDLGLARATLEDLVVGEPGALDRALLERLLAAMQEESRSPKADALGIIGKDHFLARLPPAATESFEYRRRLDPDPTSPRLAEICFAFSDGGYGRALFCGLNHSPALAGAGAFRELRCDGLGGLLNEQYVGASDPIVFALHLVGARLAFTDRGKSAVALDYSDGFDLIADIEKVTEPWRKQRLREIRDASAAARRREAFTRPERRISAKEAAEHILPEGYARASDNGDLPVTPRQIYYQCRKYIQEQTKKTLDGQYFSQTILMDYMAAHPRETQSWDITWDARGDLHEPHTGCSVPLGTLEVRAYLAGQDSRYLPITMGKGGWRTRGAKDRYGAILFVEKEGFLPLFRATRLAEKYDIAIMSTKGVSTTAARTLIDDMIGDGVRVFCIRDFDESGFKIAGTLGRDTRRYAWKTEGAVDLGLRLEDVEKWQLESEPVYYKAPRGEGALTYASEIRAKIGPGLRVNGATEREIEFLLGNRVELNAFTSADLIAWIEEKLKAHGVKKVVPDEATLAEAACGFAEDKIRARYLAKLKTKIAKEVAAIELGDLATAVAAELEEHPGHSWDHALEAIVAKKVKDKPP